MIGCRPLAAVSAVGRITEGLASQNDMAISNGRVCCCAGSRRCSTIHLHLSMHRQVAKSCNTVPAAGKTFRAYNIRIAGLTARGRAALPERCKLCGNVARVSMILPGDIRNSRNSSVVPPKHMGQ